jgi:hypothetical protein
MNSAFPKMVQPVASEAWRNLISGVLPIASMTSARICGIAFPKIDALTLFEAFAADKSAISAEFYGQKILTRRDFRASS